MTTTITINGTAFELPDGDETARLVAADALQEAGRDEEADLLRRSVADGEWPAEIVVRVADGVVTRWDAPSLLTTVDQDHGTHPATGYRMGERVEIRTRFSDQCPSSKWVDLTDDERAWWEETLESIHAADVLLAEQPVEVREMVDAGQFHGELCDWPAWVRAEIRDTREALDLTTQ